VCPAIPEISLRTGSPNVYRKSRVDQVKWLILLKKSTPLISRPASPAPGSRP
jgi:hypothetical protein